MTFDELPTLAKIPLSIFTWWVLYRIYRFWRARGQRKPLPEISLARNREGLIRQKRSLGLEIRELRIQMTDLSGEAAGARAKRRARHVRRPGKGFLGSMHRSNNVGAAYAADRAVNQTVYAKADVREAINLRQRAINDIDRRLLERERPRRKRKGSS